jgi:hypothetical protein
LIVQESKNFIVRSELARLYLVKSGEREIGGLLGVALLPVKLSVEFNKLLSSNIALLVLSYKSPVPVDDLLASQTCLRCQNSNFLFGEIFFTTSAIAHSEILFWILRIKGGFIFI